MKSITNLSPAERNELHKLVRFHWDTWEGASKKFSRVTTVIAILFVVCFTLNVGLWSDISIMNDSFKLQNLDAHRLNILRNITLFANCFLMLLLASNWIDMMRHRVPAELESYLHNDTLGEIPLGKVGKMLQITVAGVVFALMFGGVIIMSQYHPKPEAVMVVTKVEAKNSGLGHPQVQFRAVRHKLHLNVQYSAKMGSFGKRSVDETILEDRATAIPLDNNMSVTITPTNMPGSDTREIRFDGVMLNNEFKRHSQFSVKLPETSPLPIVDLNTTKSVDLSSRNRSNGASY